MPFLNSKGRSLAALLAITCLAPLGASAQSKGHSPAMVQSSAKPAFTEIEVAPGTRVRTFVLGTSSHNRAKENSKSPESSDGGSRFAAILGVLPGALTNGSLYEFINEWYGTRYSYGGTTKKGIDCSAFVQKLYERVFGISLVRTAMEQFQNSCNLCADDLKEGDLVFFKTQGSRISHVGVYLMNKFFVHSASSKGVMISNLDDKYWKGRFAGAGRVL